LGQLSEFWSAYKKLQPEEVSGYPIY